MGEIEWLNEWTLYTACTFHNSLGQFSCRHRPHVSVVEEWTKLTKTEGNRMVIYEWTLCSACTFHDSLGQFTCRPRPRICVRRVNETALCWVFVVVFHLPLVGNFSHLSRARQQQPHEQHYPCLTECTIFFCSYCHMAASAWNFWWWCMQLHMGCTKTQLGEKSLAAPGSPTCSSSSTHAWLLGPSLHQQSRILPAPGIHFDRELFVTCTMILLTGLFAVPLSH